MLDDLNPGARDGRDGHKDKAPAKAPAKARPAKDREVRSAVEREVPFGQHEERVLAASVHAWLDGELPEAAVQKGDTARDVEFWRNLNGQMERARRTRTPEHVEAQIMAALPHHAPQIITPWYEREFVITPFAAVTATAGIIAVTAAVTAALMAP
jgi:hypothetical protein